MQIAYYMLDFKYVNLLHFYFLGKYFEISEN